MRRGWYSLQDGHRRSHWEDAYEKQSPEKVENSRMWTSRETLFHFLSTKSLRSECDHHVWEAGRGHCDWSRMTQAETSRWISLGACPVGPGGLPQRQTVFTSMRQETTSEQHAVWPTFYFQGSLRFLSLKELKEDKRRVKKATKKLSPYWGWRWLGEDNVGTVRESCQILQRQQR